MLSSLLLLFSLLSPSTGHSGQPLDWTVHPLIAHALGGINGYDLTNSQEAFEANYAQGFRVFEVDLMLTRDHKDLVARHDWEKKQFQKFAQESYFPNLQNWNPLSLQEFIEFPINNRYSGMTLTDLFHKLVQYPDAYVVLDTKFTDESTIRKQFRILADEAAKIDPDLLDRVIPQLYNQPMLETIESVHVFPAYIYTLYQSKDTNQQVVDFVRSQSRVKAVAMDGSRATKAFVQSLKAVGAPVYVHTVNSESVYRKLKQAGVFGIYTDFLGYPDIFRGLQGSWLAEPPMPME